MQGLTQETILATRKFYADNCGECIKQAVSGEVFVNDIAKYIEWQTGMKNDSLLGKRDHTFTFIQHATWLQTGLCHALLP